MGLKHDEIFLANVQEMRRLARDFIDAANKTEASVKRGLEVSGSDVKWSQESLDAMQRAWIAAF